MGALASLASKAAGRLAKAGAKRALSGNDSSSARAKIVSLIFTGSTILQLFGIVNPALHDIYKFAEHRLEHAAQRICSQVLKETRLSELCNPTQSLKKRVSNWIKDKLRQSWNKLKTKISGTKIDPASGDNAAETTSEEVDTSTNGTRAGPREIANENDQANRPDDPTAKGPEGATNTADAPTSSDGGTGDPNAEDLIPKDSAVVDTAADSVDKSLAGALMDVKDSVASAFREAGAKILSVGSTAKNAIVESLALEDIGASLKGLLGGPVGWVVTAVMIGVGLAAWLAGNVMGDTTRREGPSDTWLPYWATVTATQDDVMWATSNPSSSCVLACVTNNVDFPGCSFTNNFLDAMVNQPGSVAAQGLFWNYDIGGNDDPSAPDMNVQGPTILGVTLSNPFQGRNLPILNKWEYSEIKSQWYNGSISAAQTSACKNSFTNYPGNSPSDIQWWFTQAEAESLHAVITNTGGINYKQTLYINGIQTPMDMPLSSLWSNGGGNLAGVLTQSNYNSLMQALGSNPMYSNYIGTDGNINNLLVVDPTGCGFGLVDGWFGCQKPLRTMWNCGSQYSCWAMPGNPGHVADASLRFFKDNYSAIEQEYKGLEDQKFPFIDETYQMLISILEGGLPTGPEMVATVLHSHGKAYNDLVSQMSSGNYDGYITYRAVWQKIANDVSGNATLPGQWIKSALDSAASACGCTGDPNFPNPTMGNAATSVSLSDPSVNPYADPSSPYYDPNAPSLPFQAMSMALMDGLGNFNMTVDQQGREVQTGTVSPSGQFGLFGLTPSQFASNTVQANGGALGANGDPTVATSADPASIDNSATAAMNQMITGLNNHGGDVTGAFADYCVMNDCPPNDGRWSTDAPSAVNQGWGEVLTGGNGKMGHASTSALLGDMYNFYMYYLDPNTGDLLSPNESANSQNCTYNSTTGLQCTSPPDCNADPTTCTVAGYAYPPNIVLDGTQNPPYESTSRFPNGLSVQSLVEGSAGGISGIQNKNDGSGSTQKGTAAGLLYALASTETHFATSYGDMCSSSNNPVAQMVWNNQENVPDRFGIMGLTPGMFKLAVAYYQNHISSYSSLPLPDTTGAWVNSYTPPPGLNDNGTPTGVLTPLSTEGGCPNFGEPQGMLDPAIEIPMAAVWLDWAMSDEGRGFGCHTGWSAFLGNCTKFSLDAQLGCLGTDKYHIVCGDDPWCINRCSYNGTWSTQSWGANGPTGDLIGVNSTYNAELLDQTVADYLMNFDLPYTCKANSTQCTTTSNSLLGKQAVNMLHGCVPTDTNQGCWDLSGRTDPGGIGGYTTGFTSTEWNLVDQQGYNVLFGSHNAYWYYTLLYAIDHNAPHANNENWVGDVTDCLPTQPGDDTSFGKCQDYTWVGGVLNFLGGITGIQGLVDSIKTIAQFATNDYGVLGLLGQASLTASGDIAKTMTEGITQAEGVSLNIGVVYTKWLQQGKPWNFTGMGSSCTSTTATSTCLPFAYTCMATPSSPCPLSSPGCNPTPGTVCPGAAPSTSNWVVLQKTTTVGSCPQTFSNVALNGSPAVHVVYSLPANTPPPINISITGAQTGTVYFSGPPPINTSTNPQTVSTVVSATISNSADTAVNVKIDCVLFGFSVTIWGDPPPATGGTSNNTLPIGTNFKWLCVVESDIYFQSASQSIEESSPGAWHSLTAADNTCGFPALNGQPAGGFPGSSYPGQCVWWAMVNSPLLRFYLGGNAGDFYNEMPANRKSQTPQVGWLMIIGDAYGGFGHIAVVTQVDPGGWTFVVSEMNASYTPFYNPNTGNQFWFDPWVGNVDLQRYSMSMLNAYAGSGFINPW